MFSEGVLVKPKLDGNTAKKMERDLNTRFKNVSRTFGKGLSGLFKGSILGVSAGLLAKLLNPLKEIEDRVKKLLEETTDARDTAEELGTTPGRLRQAETVAAGLGVPMEKFRETLKKYQDAVELARKELKTPGSEASKSSLVVGNFLEETDMVQSFANFAAGLRTQSAEARGSAEESVFGGKQFGGNRKVLDADFASYAKASGVPSEDILSQAIAKSAHAADIQKALEAKRNNESLVFSSNQLKPSHIVGLEAAAGREQRKTDERIGVLSDLQKGQVGLDGIKAELENVAILLSKILGYLSTFVAGFNFFKTNKFFKNLKGGD